MYCKHCDKEIEAVPGDTECPVCGRHMADKSKTAVIPPVAKEEPAKEAWQPEQTEPTPEPRLSRKQQRAQDREDAAKEKSDAEATSTPAYGDYPEPEKKGDGYDQYTEKSE